MQDVFVNASNKRWTKNCQHCGSVQAFNDKFSMLYAVKRNSRCNKCKGFTKAQRVKMSSAASRERVIRHSDKEYQKRFSAAVKAAMHSPHIRAKHLKALRESQWIKVKTDKGQLELLEKWNKLGFHFVANYQVNTETGLFYVDGYDESKRVIIEYDSKYHNRICQQQKDLIRQQQLIVALKPKRFWRFNSVNKTMLNVLV